MRAIAIATTDNPIAASIGENTHHQDHEITPSSFRVIKTIVRRPIKPMPDELELELELDIIFSLSEVLEFPLRPQPKFYRRLLGPRTDYI